MFRNIETMKMDIEKLDSDENHMNFAYIGNVNCKNQTVKEAVDEYYKSIDKTPKFGDAVTINSDSIYVYLNIPEEKCSDSFIYRGNVKCWKSKPIKEAVDEYYKSIDKTPKFGDVVTINSDSIYVYLNEWEKMKLSY